MALIVGGIDPGCPPFCVPPVGLLIEVGELTVGCKRATLQDRLEVADVPVQEFAPDLGKRGQRFIPCVTPRSDPLSTLDARAQPWR